jgi:hypothetical protein
LKHFNTYLRPPPPALRPLMMIGLRSDRANLR